jgi:mRNA-degrading endonuclease RelE of RelBE toxin-antitoxin system
VKVVVSDQVVESVRRLAPESRRLVRRALRELAAGKGDVRQLEAPLDGYNRLRVSAYRLIFSYGTRRTIECVFAERRSLAYEVFARVLAEQFTAPLEEK